LGDKIKKSSLYNKMQQEKFGLKAGESHHSHKNKVDAHAGKMTVISSLFVLLVQLWSSPLGKLGI